MFEFSGCPKHAAGTKCWLSYGSFAAILNQKSKIGHAFEGQIGIKCHD
jgi:hypothetical protein